MTVRYFKCTDPGAPYLTGGFGSMIELFDRCLVSGYGPRSALINSGTRLTFTAQTASTSWYFAGWIKPDANAVGAGRHFFLFDSTNGVGIGLSGGKLNYFSGAADHVFSTTLSANTIYFIIMTSNGSTVSAYINGVVEAATATATTFQPGILMSNGGGTENYTGNVQEWIFNSASQLSTAPSQASNAAALYSAGTTGAGVNYAWQLDQLVAPAATTNMYWRFDELAGSTVIADNIQRNTSTRNATIAAGSITFDQTSILSNTAQKTAAGWSKPFSAASKASYLNVPAGIAFPTYLDMDNTTNSQSNIRCYEAMSAVGTGTNPFPTTVQAATCRWDGGQAGSGRGAPWVIVADAARVYYWTDSNTSQLNGTGGEFFSCGNIKVVNSTDLWASYLAYASSTAGGNTTGTSFSTSGISGSTTNFHVMRQVNGGVGSQIGSRTRGPFNSSSQSGVSGIGSGSALGPNKSDNGLYLSKAYCGDTSQGGQYRGTMPGLWFPEHQVTGIIPNFTEIAGNGPLSGKTFISLLVASTTACIWIETSDTWDI